MASTDARPVPRKNVAYRVTFPIFDADGDLVTGAAGLDSEISKDGGTFADVTAEATEIATSSGVYYLDLSATEMNADTVAIIVKTSTVGAKTTVIVMYPEESGDYRADVTFWNGTAVATPATAGYPAVTLKVGTGTGEINLSSGSVPVSSLGTDTITSTALATSAVTEIQSGLATSASISALNNISTAQVNAELLDVLTTDTFAQPGQETPAATTTMMNMLRYLYKAWRNKRTVTSSEYALYADDTSTKDQEAALSDDGTTFQQNEMQSGA